MAETAGRIASAAGLGEGAGERLLAETRVLFQLRCLVGEVTGWCLFRTLLTSPKKR